jgi:di/tricarboxylate transporter
MILDVSLLHLWATYAIILAAMIAYSLDRFALELTSIAVLGAILVLFQFFPLIGADGHNLMPMEKVLAGFADPALVAILSMLIVAQGIIQTGALDEPVTHFLRVGGNSPNLVIFATLAIATAISAFINDTPVVVIFIPIMAALAERLGRSNSSVMMPLGFAAIFGGMVTLIGTSTNLLAAGTYQAVTGETVGFFDFTVPGLVLVVVGLLYLFFVAPRLLPRRAGAAEDTANGRGRQFISQIEVMPGNPLVGQRPVAGMFPGLPGVTVRAIRRDRTLLLPPFEGEIEEGDSLILAATRRTLTELVSRSPAIVIGALNLPSDTLGGPDQPISGNDRILAEVVVAPASRMEGRTIEQTGFRDQTRCIVFGIQRRSRMSRSGLDDIRLEAGDVLLVLGRRDDVLALREQRDVLLLEWSAQELPVKTRARIAVGIFIGVILSAASGLLPITVAGLLGAGAMIGTGCLNIRQASRAVNRRIVMIVGAALAMGQALQVTGGAEHVAYGVVHLLEGSSPAILLSAYFLITAVFSNVLSHTATAVLFTPIGVSIAHQTGADPRVFLYATIFAANSAFATPMGYQTNLLIMGPGDYGFRDFLKVGGPLTLLVWITFSLFAWWYYGL